MKLADYEYKPISVSNVKKYSIHPLKDDIAGVDKYLYDFKSSYVHNYLPKFKALRYEKVYPEGIQETKTEEEKTERELKTTESVLDNTSQKTRNKLGPDDAMHRQNLTDNRNTSQDKRKEILKNEVKHTLTYTNKDNQRYYSMAPNKSGMLIQKKTPFNLASSSIMKPIHVCNRNPYICYSCEKRNEKYKDNYYNNYYTIKKSIQDTNVLVTENNMNSKKKEDPLGFTIKNVPIVPLKEDFNPTETFKLFNIKLKTSVSNHSFAEENEKLAQCLKDYDTLANFPRLPALMNQNQIKNVFYKSLGKSMGEKYDPHNYRNDILKSRIKRNEIGTKLH